MTGWHLFKNTTTTITTTTNKPFQMVTLLEMSFLEELLKYQPVLPAKNDVLANVSPRLWAGKQMPITNDNREINIIQSSCLSGFWAAASTTGKIQHTA